MSTSLGVYPLLLIEFSGLGSCCSLCRLGGCFHCDAAGYQQETCRGTEAANGGCRQALATDGSIHGEMTPEVVFPSISVLRALQLFMTPLPQSFSFYGEMVAAHGRIEDFLKRFPPREQQVAGH